jgi:hypothetical protein
MSKEEVTNAKLSGDAKKEVSLRIFIESFDVFVRGVAEITAELRLTGELTVEGLMAYWLSLPECDNLVRDFIRGDLSMFSLSEETRHMVERDLGRLELEPPGLIPTAPLTTKLGKKLDSSRREDAGAQIGRERASDLERFIQNNPEIVKQVAGSTHEILVMWVMLYLMHGTKARERGQRAAGEFVKKHPGVQERIRAFVDRQSQGPRVAARQEHGPRIV